MSSATTEDVKVTPDETSLSRGVGEVWLGHLLVFAIPLTATLFVWSGPHPWYIAPLFLIPLAVFQWWDTRDWMEKSEPEEELPDWPFDLLVYMLAALHFFMLVGLVHLFVQQSAFSLDMVMVVAVVGGSSGFSIITAHELIHRKEAFPQTLGRIMLSSVLYEHFYTEHLRGHHVRVGTDLDAATARYGETFREFWKRTVPGQFRSAWSLECARLGDEEMGILDPRQSNNRIVHGLLLGWGVAFGILAFFGWPAFLAYVLQAFIAVRLLEAVNYFEHWGLQRSGRRVKPTDSWDTHSWFTYYGLVGLSRHADHHTVPSRPYQALRVCDEAPVLPVGYLALVDMVLARNDEFIKIAKSVLRDRKLGPFASEEGEGLALLEDQRVIKAPLLQRLLTKLPVVLRKTLVPVLVLLAISFGAWMEADGAYSFQWTLLRNGLIAGIFVGLFIAQRRFHEWVQNAWLSWGCAIALLCVIGTSLKGVIG